jgi:hypothetical protein
MVTPKIIAILDMSAGNESVGDMWKESKIFEPSDSLEVVIQWALDTKSRDSNQKWDRTLGNLILTIAR